MALGLIVAGIYIPLAPFLFHWLFPEYNSVILYSQIFSLSLVSIATNISNTTLLAQRKQKELYHVNTIVPIIKIIFTITGIWYFGIWGAIISKMFSQILLLMFSSYYLLKNDSFCLQGA